MPYNIVDNMKKMNVTMSMWNSLAIPGQTDLLKKALSEEKNPMQVIDDGPRVVLTNAVPEAASQDSNKFQGKNVKPPPFYVSLIIGDKLVHNCMVDSGATSSVMPKKIADQLGLVYRPLEKGVVQLDGSTVNTLGVVKDANLTLHACPNFSIPQDIFVIDLPPYFALCLSREFTAKIGGYLSSDWSHMLFRTHYGTKVTIKLVGLSKNHI